MDNKVAILDFSAASPDLNPIDNVWNIIKEKVGKLQPWNVARSRDTISQAWLDLPQATIDNFDRQHVNAHGPVHCETGCPNGIFTLYFKKYGQLPYMLQIFNEIY